MHDRKMHTLQIPEFSLVAFDVESTRDDLFKRMNVKS